jgi:hypothetical protein
LDKLVYLQSLPLGRQEASLGDLRAEWMDHILIIEFEVEVMRIDLFISILATSDSLDELQVSLGQLHIPIVEHIPDLEPPVLVLLSVDELRQLVLLYHLLHLLTLD